MKELIRALKTGEVIEVETDLYLVDDGREFRYDRYRRGVYKWVSSDGFVYRSFFEALHKEGYFRKEV